MLPKHDESRVEGLARAPSHKTIFPVRQAAHLRFPLPHRLVPSRPLALNNRPARLYHGRHKVRRRV